MCDYFVRFLLFLLTDSTGPCVAHHFVYPLLTPSRLHCVGYWRSFPDSCGEPTCLFFTVFSTTSTNGQQPCSNLKLFPSATTACNSHVVCLSVVVVRFFTTKPVLLYLFIFFTKAFVIPAIAYLSFFVIACRSFDRNSIFRHLFWCFFLTILVFFW